MTRNPRTRKSSLGHALDSLELGANEKADKVEVSWPGGGSTILKNLPARRYYLIQEPPAAQPGGKP